MSNPFLAPPANEEVASEPQREIPKFGMAAIAIGLFAVVLSILTNFYFEPPQRAKSSITIDLGLVKWERLSESAEAVPTLSQMVDPYHAQLATIATGLIAIILSMVSWYRREGFWPGVLGVTTAIAAMAFIWFVFAFVCVLMSGGFCTFAPATKPSPSKAD